MTERKSTIKLIARTLVIVLLLLVTVVNVLTVIFTSAGLRTQLNWVPYAFLSVTSGSMEPDISAGDMIIVKDYPYESLRAGDIVTYMDSYGGFTTHRLVRLDGDRFITKGTANSTEDSPVEASAYCAKMVAVLPGFGKVLNLLSQPVSAIIAVAAVIILFFGVPALISLIQKKKAIQGSAGVIKTLSALALASVFAGTPYMTAARYRDEINDYKIASAAYVCFTSNYMSQVNVQPAPSGAVTGGNTYVVKGWEGKTAYTLPVEIRNYKNQLIYNKNVDVPYVLYLKKDSASGYIDPAKYDITITTSTSATSGDKNSYHAEVQSGNIWTGNGYIYGPYLLEHSDGMSCDSFTVKVEMKCDVYDVGAALPEGVKEEDIVRCGESLHFILMSCTDKNTTFYQELKGDYTFKLAESTDFVHATITDNASSGGVSSFVSANIKTTLIGTGLAKNVYIYWDAEKMYLNTHESTAVNAINKSTLYYDGVDDTIPSGCEKGIGKMILPLEGYTSINLNFIKFNSYTGTDLSGNILVTSKAEDQPSYS